MSSTATQTLCTLNTDPAVSGIMLHMPVPAPLDSFTLQQVIAAEKDVEGVGPVTVAMLLANTVAAYKRIAKTG